MGKIGNAAITWSSTSDKNTERVHLLDVPLRMFRPSHTVSQFTQESLDKTNVETFRVGEGAYELVAEVRFDQNPQSLIDLVKAGSLNRTLTYYPNLNDVGVSYACVLISPRSPTDLGLDPDRGTLGDQAVTLRFRLTNEAGWTGLLRGTNVLFSYRAGDQLSTAGQQTATFTRVTTSTASATYAAKGYGTLSTAKTNVARISWLSTKSTAGPRNRPALLLEGARTNQVKHATNLGSTNWTLVNSLTRTSAQTDPAGGTNAWLLSDNSTTLQGRLRATVTPSSNGKHGVSVFLKAGTTLAAAGTKFQLFTSSSAVRFQATVTFTSGLPTQTVNTGTTFAKPERWANGFWRFSGITTTGVLTANTNRFEIVPATTSQKGNVYAYGPQVE